MFILRVFRAEERDSSDVLIAVGDDARPSAHVNPGEAGPILAVAVNDNGDTRIGADVSDPLEVVRGHAVWVGGQRGGESGAGGGGDHQGGSRLAAGVNRGQSRNPLLADKFGLPIGHAALHDIWYVGGGLGR